MPPESSPVDSLIIDIGLHNGDDTAFYLQKGFSVVAVEANPAHVEHCRGRFVSEINEGRLTIVHAAIAEASAPITFYVNQDKDDWSSTDPRYGARAGSKYQTITVPGLSMRQLLDEHVGDREIHYLKSDIEGGDVHVLRGLLDASLRPRFLSVEAHDAGYFAYLYVLGYRRFKLVNQNLNWRIVLPNPAREGRYVDFSFRDHSSGPFGTETTGAWISFPHVMELFSILRRSEAIEPGISNAWYDVHVARD